MTPRWALHHLVGWTLDGRKVNRYFKSYEKMRALARTMPINSCAFLRAVPISAVEQYLFESENYLPKG